MGYPSYLEKLVHGTLSFKLYELAGKLSEFQNHSQRVINILYTWECFYLSPLEYPGCGEGGDVQDHPADAQECKGTVNESHLSSQKDG